MLQEQRLIHALEKFMAWVERGAEKDTPHGHYLKHSQLVEYRQLMTEVSIARDRAQKAEISVRGWINRVVKDHGLEGLNCRITQENGEIMVLMDPIRYRWQQTVEHAEQIAVGRNIWTEEPEQQEPPITEEAAAVHLAAMIEAQGQVPGPHCNEGAG